MNKFFKSLVVAALVAVSSACTVIDTGEVGLRVGVDKQVKSEELQAGSFNQTVFGSVLTFPIRDVAITLDNRTPMTSDNSALADFDATVLYNINPNAVSELWSKKSKSFHAYDEKHNDTLLMHTFITTVANNAIYKSVRKYKALEVQDNRQQIEIEIKEHIIETLKEEKLDTALIISGVQVRSIQPAKDIVESANAVIRAQNGLKEKTVEVETAKKEAERIAVLNSNAGAVQYMLAQAQVEIAHGIANGKVNTIVVPMDFKGMVNVGK